MTFAPAVRDRVGLLIGIAGASGSGKSLSALKIARGLAAGDDAKIGVIDTEGGRAKHYAPAPGEAPGPETFAFRHADLRAPFTPEAYRDRIIEGEEAGFEVIVIDSFTHVWDGDGGLQDMQAVLVEAAVAKARANAERNGWRFDEQAAGDRASVGAWKEPKARHKRMVSRLLQCRAHLVICMRADEKMRMETVEENGRKRTVIIQPKDMPVNERWVPIVERRFPYELTTSLLLTPLRPGVPIPIKLQEQHRHAVPLDRPLSEETGRALAEWARGGAAPVVAADGGNRTSDDAAADDGPSSEELLFATERLSGAARGGEALLAEEWKSTPRAVKAILKTRLDAEWKPAAVEADKRADPDAYQRAKEGAAA